ncbi:MAG: NAD(P)-dependent alcohol dehydrogenase [Leptospiraceae bacterium]|nr:NAD(P)-dependent alcohol dehydrogenase [Leptospiraceae bacterium]MCZ8345648.1 NAD(P)-dependent alcohol dehydrogenase [Leptospiraceae bacterium]PJD99502.1 MAG: alcohol dehydrogenase [Leptospira sp.]
MSKKTVNAWAIKEKGKSLEPFTYELPSIGLDQVDLKVLYCGICHSDLSMMQNDWGNTTYPLVPGHEVVGEVIDLGSQVKNLKVGDKVGLGWMAGSCMHCDQCMSGSHNLCSSLEQTIVGRHGGFADLVRCHWSWAIPIPKNLDLSKAGPLFCGGITVFNPIDMVNVKPTAKVGVIGIGGLGHLALKFLKSWGCEVTAFSSNPNKSEEIKAMGAHHIVDSRNSKAMIKIKGSLDFILNTTNVSLDWEAYIQALAPKGTLHHVGAVLEPMAIGAFSLIGGEKKISGSPLGSPALNRLMLDFCERHNILPTVEEFPMKNVNQAIEHLHSGKARYRVVLKN